MARTQSHTYIFTSFTISRPPPSSIFHQLILTHSQSMEHFSEDWLSGLAPPVKVTCLHLGIVSKALLVCRVILLHCVEPQASSSVVITNYYFHISFWTTISCSQILWSLRNAFLQVIFRFIVNTLVSLSTVLPLYAMFSCSVCPLFLSLFHTFLSPLSRSLSPFFTPHFSDLSFPWDLPSCWFSPKWVNTLPDEWPLQKTLEDCPRK